MNLRIPRPEKPVATDVFSPMVYAHQEYDWEYHLLTVNLQREEPPGEEKLNNLGKDGWEMTGLFTHNQMLYLCFKRLKHP